MRNNKRVLIGLMMVIMIATITGCASSRDAKAQQPPDKNTVNIQSYSFQPAEITIRKGETVTWINQDSVDHTITGNSFDSGLFGKGQSFKQTFNESGIFEYHCSPHPNMKGKVIVQ
jgi:plastocyanin